MNNFKFDQHFIFSRVPRWIAVSAMAASLALLSTPGAGAQDAQQGSSQQQPDDQQGPPPPPSQQQPDDQQGPPPPPSAQQPDDQQQGPPPPPPQDRRRVISRDDMQQNGQDQGPDQAPPPPNRRPYGRPYNQRSVGDLPAAFTVPAGKVIFVRLNEPLSSDHNHAGDTFTATLDQPVVINGWVVARRGETVIGTVTTAQKAGRVKGTSQLGLELTDLTIVDGNQIPISSELWKGSAGTSHGADAAGIATTTGVGAAIGAAVNGGTGAGVGAGIGAVTGIAGVLLTRGKPTVLGPETQLSFRLKDPINISTENSRQAFQPVGDGDYNGSQGLRRRGPYPGSYPGPYYAGYPYYGYYGYPYYGSPYYGYWGPSVGFYYGGYWGRGFGHGFRR